jgi:hypothetical protein
MTMGNAQPLFGTFHDAETGITVTRELTADEITALHLDNNENSLPTD